MSTIQETYGRRISGVGSVHGVRPFLRWGVDTCGTYLSATTTICRRANRNGCHASARATSRRAGGHDFRLGVHCWRDGYDRWECGCRSCDRQPHIDYGDDAGSCGWSRRRRGRKSGWSERPAGGGVHLRRSSPCSAGRHGGGAGLGADRWRDDGYYLGDGLRVRSDGDCWRCGGRLRDRRERQLDHGRSASAERRQRRPCRDQPGRAERPTGRVLHVHRGGPDAISVAVTVSRAGCADGHGDCTSLGLDGRRNGRDADRNRLRVWRNRLV